jgi:hypothetical protein
MERKIYICCDKSQEQLKQKIMKEIGDKLAELNLDLSSS